MKNNKPALSLQLKDKLLNRKCETVVLAQRVSKGSCKTTFCILEKHIDFKYLFF